MVHMDMERARCALCQKMFKNKYSLSTHLHRQHPDFVQRHQAAAAGLGSARHGAFGRGQLLDNLCSRSMAKALRQIHNNNTSHCDRSHNAQQQICADALASRTTPSSGRGSLNARQLAGPSACQNLQDTDKERYGTPAVAPRVNNDGNSSSGPFLATD